MRQILRKWNLHEYLIGNVNAEKLKSIDDLPDSENLYNLYCDKVKENFFNNISKFFKYDISRAYFVDPAFIDRSKFRIEKSDTE